MIEATDDSFIDDVVKMVEVARVLCRLALDRDQDHIVMSMPVRIITFSERSPVLLRRELIGVKPVGGAKSIAPRHMYLRHTTISLFIDR